MKIFSDSLGSADLPNECYLPAKALISTVSSCARRYLRTSRAVVLLLASGQGDKAGQEWTNRKAASAFRMAYSPRQSIKKQRAKRRREIYFFKSRSKYPQMLCRKASAENRQNHFALLPQNKKSLLTGKYF